MGCNPEWNPEIAIDLNINFTSLEDSDYEVVLSLEVTASTKQLEIFKAKAQQAGIFRIKGFSPENEKQLINAYCPSILFPYARETIAIMVARAGFPQLNLAPVNFDTLYQQSQNALRK